MSKVNCTVLLSSGMRLHRVSPVSFAYMASAACAHCRAPPIFSHRPTALLAAVSLRNSPRACLAGWGIDFLKLGSLNLPLVNFSVATWRRWPTTVCYLAADDPRKLPHLHSFSESSFGEPLEHFEFDGRRFSRSSLNYLLGLAVLKKHLESDMPRTIMEVGGGFGTLGEVLSSTAIDGLRYIDIDIPPMNFIAQHYLSQVFGKDNVATYAQTRDQCSIDISLLPEASVLCSWQIERLQGKVDVFVNFISFQEMEPQIVKNYLGHVARLGSRWVLLRNIREGMITRKDNSSFGVDIPILSDDYPSMLPGYKLVERNVLPFGYQTVDGYHSELLLLRRIA